MTQANLYIGLISGTSVDGVDCVLVEFDGKRPNLIASLFKPSSAKLRERILHLCDGEEITLKMLGQTDTSIGHFFADAATELLEVAKVPASAVRAIGSHGQTVWHQPDGRYPFTMQLGNPNIIAQQTGITVVGDMRGRDMAAGGEGAPLAPLLHRNVFHSQNVDRAVINIGGISNLTVLPREGACTAFDTGPGNVLMDYWIDKHRQQRYDKDGAWAASGQFNLGLLNALLDEPYFSRPLPKSTGRELFNGRWLESRLGRGGMEIPAADVQATLLTLTVTTIVRDLTRYCAPQEIYVCGGGAHNKTLMSELSKVASDISVTSTASLGVDPDWVEAIAFAWMAQQTVNGEKIDTSAFTGAREPVFLGGIYQA